MQPSPPDRMAALIRTAERLRTVRSARQRFLLLWAVESSEPLARLRQLSKGHRSRGRNMQRDRRMDDEAV